MKTLISAFLLLALAVPAAHAQDNQNAFCDACNAIADGAPTVAIGSGNPFFIHPDAHEVRPTTLPNLDFSKDRHWVHVSGVALVDGQPVPNAQVNVIAELDGDYNKYQLAVADDRGVYNAWFHAPATITHVTVDVQNICSTGRDEDCAEDFNTSIGAGATVSGADSY